MCVTVNHSFQLSLLSTIPSASLDYNLPSTPRSGLWGRITDAMVEIFLAKSIDAVFKSVDNFVFVRYPIWRADTPDPTFYDEAHLWSIVEELGWP